MNNCRGSGFGSTLVLALLFVALVLAAGIGLARYGDRVGWIAPLIGQPSQTSGPVVVQGIQRLNELATVKWTTQVIIIEEGSGTLLQRYLPESLIGEKVLLVAVGEVQAGVDLDELGQDDVEVEGGKVTIRLPEARILGSSLDEDKKV